MIGDEGEHVPLYHQLDTGSPNNNAVEMGKGVGKGSYALDRTLDAIEVRSDIRVMTEARVAALAALAPTA